VGRLDLVEQGLRQGRDALLELGDGLLEPLDVLIRRSERESVENVFGPPGKRRYPL
jgi:hypothetical protein